MENLSFHISSMEETYKPEVLSYVFGLASASDKPSSSNHVLELGAPSVGNAVSTVMSPPSGPSLHDGQTLPASGQSPKIQLHAPTLHVPALVLPFQWQASQLIISVVQGVLFLGHLPVPSNNF